MFWQVREYVITQSPQANELIWDNYNAVALAYSRSQQLKDAFCHIAIYSKHVNFGFNRGVELTPNTLKLQGKGKLIRHITITASLDELPSDELTKYLREAQVIAEVRNPKLAENSDAAQSIVMSISEKKNRPS
ncbi:MAG: DUF1801 domain-containing protein [Bacteroidota bacterium]